MLIIDKHHFRYDLLLFVRNRYFWINSHAKGTCGFTGDSYVNFIDKEYL